MITDFCNGTISNSRFESNSATDSGGVIKADGNSIFSLTGSHVSNNEAERGGGMSLDNSSTGLLEFCEFSENRASNAGGAVNVNSSLLFLISSVFNSNEAIYVLNKGSIHVLALNVKA